MAALVDAPAGLLSKASIAEATRTPYASGIRRPAVNCLEREARNRALGAACDEFGRAAFGL